MLLLLFLYHHFHNCAGVTDWAHPGTMVYLCKIYAVFKWGKKNPHAASEPRRTSPLLQLIYNTQIAFFVGRARKAWGLCGKCLHRRKLWQFSVFIVWQAQLPLPELFVMITETRPTYIFALVVAGMDKGYVKELSNSCFWESAAIKSTFFLTPTFAFTIRPITASIIFILSF